MYISSLMFFSQIFNASIIHFFFLIDFWWINYKTIELIDLLHSDSVLYILIFLKYYINTRNILIFLYT